MTIHQNGEVTGYYIDGGPASFFTFPLSVEKQEWPLKELISLLKKSIENLEEIMQQYRIELSSRVHQFFTQVRTDLSSSAKVERRNSTTQDIENLIIDYTI